MAIELTLRIGLGRALTPAEMDANFTNLKAAIETVEGQSNVALNPDGTLKVGAVSATDRLADGIVTLAKLHADLQALFVKTGMVFGFGGTTAPDGYLLCTGQAVSRTTYAALFAVVGTVYGVGDGSTTFNVPDLRGRAPVGAGTGDAAHASVWSLGQKKGAEKYALTTAQLPAHTHTLTQANANADGNDYNSDEGLTGHNAAGSAGSNTKTTSETGSGDAHDTVPPSLGLNFIIKT